MTKAEQLKKVYSMATFAKFLGISRQAIHGMVRRKTLKKKTGFDFKRDEIGRVLIYRSPSVQ